MQLTEKGGAALAAVTKALETTDCARIGVAVSGGSDSLALMMLLKEACTARGATLRAVSVDHGLRPGSGAELDEVAAICAAQGISHDRLEWRGWDGQGNLQNEARKARYALMTDWARCEKVGAICLGHTMDDQAETVLLRLARKSGSAGLSGMRARIQQGVVTWLRPLLTVRRETLQAYLKAQGIAWIDDPSNEDATFDRVKARRALAALEPLGIGPETLSDVAGNLARENRVLYGLAQEFARRHARQAHGAVALNIEAFAELDPEIALRLLSAVIGWITGAPYPPRREALCKMLRALQGMRSHTLGGVIGVCRKGEIWLAREPGAGGGDAERLGKHWRVTGVGQGEELRTLGAEGLAQIEDWRDLGLPREALMTLPSIWSGERLLWAPVQAGLHACDDQRGAELIRPSFAKSLEGH